MATTARQQYFADESSIQKDSREFAIADDVQQKIDSIEEGAQVNTIETIRVNGTDVEPDQDKVVDITIPDVIDSLSSTSTTDALSAKQGKVLYDKIQNIESRGRFLSNWNCATGLPVTNPEEDPYVYAAGDYYTVSNVAASGGTNYRPDGTSYIRNQASITPETDTVAVSDFYLFDGTSWLLLVNSARQIAIDSSLSTTSTNPVENRKVTQAINSKQDVLTVGVGINIDSNNEISNTQPGPIISAAQPSTANEGDQWYDTTNSVLKVYNGTQWNEVGSEGNTKTFYLSSTSDLVNAQAAYDWYIAGKNPIIVYGKMVYTLCDYYTSVSALGFLHIERNGNNTASYHWLQLFNSGGTVSSISKSEASESSYYLLKNNTTSFTPSGDYNPATKKYVDDNAIAFKAFPNTFDTTHTTSDFLDSIELLNLPVGSAYLGQVSLSDMPSGVTMQGDVEVYVHPQNIIYAVMKSTDVAPYEWIANSQYNRGWEPTNTDTTYTAGANVSISAQNIISATDTTYVASDFDIKDLADSTGLRTDWSGKQDELIAGTNIQIAADGKTISATDTTYTAGDGIDIDANNEISVDVTDIVGTGLSEDANNNITIDTTVVATQSDVSSRIPFVPSGSTITYNDYQIYKSENTNNQIGTIAVALNYDGIKTEVTNSNNIHSSARIDVFPDKAEVFIKETDNTTLDAKTIDIYAGEIQSQEYTNGVANSETYEFQGGGNNQIARLKDVNTKTFYLSSTSDLVNAQAAIDYILSGKNAIVSYQGVNYIYATYSSNNYNKFFDFDNSELATNTSGSTVTKTHKRLTIRVAISTNVVNNISISNVVVSDVYSVGTGLTKTGTTLSADTTVLATKADLANLGSFEVVASLPSVDTANEKTIYLLGPIGSGADKYEEWIVTDATGTLSFTGDGSSYTPNTITLSSDTTFVYSSSTGTEAEINFDNSTDYWYVYTELGAGAGWYLYDTTQMGSSAYTFIDATTVVLPAGSYGIAAGQTYDTITFSTSTKVWTKIGETSVDLTNYLAKDNTTSFTPSGDYNPATKKYVDDIKPTSGSTAPSTTPTFVGQQYVDTTADKMYVATGTSSSSDWMEVGAGSGDVVGPSSATDGHLAVFDGVTGKLVKDGGAVPTGFSPSSSGTTGQVLKKTATGYDWGENAEFFHLSSTSDLTTALAIVQSFLAGRDPIVTLEDTDESDATDYYRVIWDKSDTTNNAYILTLTRFRDALEKQLNINYHYNDRDIVVSSIVYLTNFSAIVDPTQVTPGHLAVFAGGTDLEDGGAVPTVPIEKFTLSDTGDTTTAEAIVQSYLNGKEPVVIYTYNGDIYHFHTSEFWDYGNNMYVLRFSYMAEGNGIVLAIVYTYLNNTITIDEIDVMADGYIKKLTSYTQGNIAVIRSDGGISDGGAVPTGVPSGGNNGDVLTNVSGTPTWQQPSGGTGVVHLAGDETITGIKTFTANDGTMDGAPAIIAPRMRINGQTGNNRFKSQLDLYKGTTKKGYLGYFEGDGSNRFEFASESRSIPFYIGLEPWQHNNNYSIAITNQGIWRGGSFDTYSADKVFAVMGDLNNRIQNDTVGTTSTATKIWTGSETEYANLSVINPDELYFTFI